MNMKRILLLITVFIFTQQIKSQEQFNIGVNGGVTVGETIGTYSDMAFGLDVNYLFQLSEDFVVGPSLALTYFNTKEVEGFKPDAFMYLPISAAIRFNSLDDPFYAGVDVGFAVGLSPDGDSGGVYIKPIVGYNINDSFKLNLFYAGIRKTKITNGYVGFGVTYDLKGTESESYF